MANNEKGKEMAKTNAKRAPRILDDQTQNVPEGKELQEPIKGGTEVPGLDDKGRKTSVEYSMEQLDKMGLKNKSQVIRFLHSEQHAPSAIAKFLNIRYQFVRNVINQPLKRQTLPVNPNTANKEG